jgi:hypothetical protein
MLHVGLREHFLQRRGEIVEYQNGLGAGIFQLMPQLTRGIHRVGVDHHQTGTQGAKERDRILQHIGQHDRDAITFAELQHTGEVTGKLPTRLVNFAIAERLAEIGEGRAISKVRESLVDHRRDRSVIVDIDLRWHAGRVVIQPRTFIAHAWFLNS